MNKLRIEFRVEIPGRCTDMTISAVCRSANDISVLKEQILRYLDNREIEYRHAENGGNYDA